MRIFVFFFIGLVLLAISESLGTTTTRKGDNNRKIKFRLKSNKESSFQRGLSPEKMSNGSKKKKPLIPPSDKSSRRGKNSGKKGKKKTDNLSKKHYYYYCDSLSVKTSDCISRVGYQPVKYSISPEILIEHCGSFLINNKASKKILTSANHLTLDSRNTVIVLEPPAAPIDFVPPAAPIDFVPRAAPIDFVQPAAPIDFGPPPLPPEASFDLGPPAAPIDFGPPPLPPEASFDLGPPAAPIDFGPPPLPPEASFDLGPPTVLGSQSNLGPSTVLRSQANPGLQTAPESQIELLGGLSTEIDSKGSPRKRKHKMNRIVAPKIQENELPNLHCIIGNGLRYRGYTNTTVSGTKCDMWSNDYPQFNGHNYCRNPDGQEKPWCFSRDTELGWEQCNIPQCVPSEDVERDLIDHHGLTYKGEALTGLSGKPCLHSVKKNFTLVNCLESYGTNYAGTISTTKSGRRCKNWSLGDPTRSLKYGELFGPDVRNYCRNPDNSWTPWCFVGKNGTTREDCDVPRCDCNRENLNILEISRENVCSRFVHDHYDIPWCYVSVDKPEPCLFLELFKDWVV